MRMHAAPAGGAPVGREVTGAPRRPLLSGELRDGALQLADALTRTLPAAAATDHRNPSLASGSAGLAVCAGQLARTRSDQMVADVALEHLEAAVDVLATEPLTSSLYSGFTGIAWAVELVDRLLGNESEDRNGDIDDALTGLLQRYPDDAPYDLINGLTGLGVYALARWPRPGAAPCLLGVVEQLARRARHDRDGIYWWTPPSWRGPRGERYQPAGVDLGVAHGVAGVIPFLARVHRLGLAQPAVRSLLDGCVHWLLAHLVDTASGPTVPYYVADGVEPGPARSAWCYGDPGVAAALLLAARDVGEPSWAAAGLDEAVAADRIQLRRRLEDFVTTPEFRDALFVASPSLAAAVDPWRKEPDSDRGRATERSLVSYLLRAAARPTPFGLFAGCTTGITGERTRLRLEGPARYRRRTRLDMDYLWALADAVERDPRLRDELDYRPNSSLYQVGDRLLFAEELRGQAGISYRLVAVDTTPYLMQTLTRARDGARLGALAAALVSDDITRADADGYLAELAASQILVADIRPQLTGPPPAGTLAASLERHERSVGLARALGEAADGLAAIDADGIGVPAERYRAVAGALDSLPASPEPSRFVQVDMMKPAAEVTVGADVVSELERGVAILHALSRYRRHEGLRQFREQFVRRYETREVPLADALDEENGIGFERSGSPAAEVEGTAPLLAGLPLSAGLPLGWGQDQAAQWTRREAFLLDKLTRAVAAGNREIAVEAAEAEALRDGDIPPLPDAFEVMATVVAGRDRDNGRDDHRDDHRVVLHSASGPSGARLLGRFCHADDELHQLVRAHLAAEEAVCPERVFAEVVHLPEGRIGNILSRPVLRGYEIPYLGRSGAPADRQLPVSDLLVSVQDERIMLRSRRLGREVIPRLTTAHNHITRGLGVYRFLCALHYQQVSPWITWDWGPLGQAPFLPRVVSGRLILSRARWNLRDEDIAAFREPRGARQFAAVQRLRDSRRMPRYVAPAGWRASYCAGGSQVP